MDVIIAQGTEAGGHTGTIGTLLLLQIVLDTVKTPVLAAGGIASGRGFAAVLAAGADGAWIGTPFLLAHESRTTAAVQAKILESDETQTILTSVFDRIQSKPWPPEYHGRALVNNFTNRWHGHEDEMATQPNVVESYRLAKADGDYATASIYAGQSVGLVHTRTNAREIIMRLVQEAQEHLLAAADRAANESFT